MPNALPPKRILSISNDNRPTHSDGAAADHTLSVVTGKGWMQGRLVASAARQMSPNEVTSLSALIAYVAHKSGESEFGVERRLSDRFNVANVKCLSADQFDNAMRYLVDGMGK